MIRRRLLVSALAACALAALAPAALADTRPHIEFRVTGITGPVRIGQPIQATAKFKPSQPTTLKSFSFAMRRATVVNNAPPDSIVLPAGDSLEVSFSVAAATEEELIFEVFANGKRYKWVRDLSQLAWDYTHRYNIVGFDPQPDPPLFAQQEATIAVMSRPAPIHPEVGGVSPAGRPVGTLELATRMAAPQGVAANITHHLLGKVRYQRPDMSKDGVDGASYTIWLSIPGVDIPVAAGITDPLGRYDETVIIPSSLGRSFYLTFDTNNSWVHVRDNDDDDDPYHFQSGIFDGNAAGGDKLQNFLVTNTNLAPMCHALSMVVRGFRWVLDNTSYQFGPDIDDLDVSYPEGDWPHYTYPAETIYLPPNSDSRWSTGTLLHEFGHHVNWELPIESLQVDYDDGNCEAPGGDPRHCTWCGEEDLNVAVGEGFATWFQDVVVREFVQLYGVVAYDPKDDVEDLSADFQSTNCNLHDPYATEGYFIGLLRDLDDDTPGESDHFTFGNYPDLLEDPEDRIALGANAVLDLLVDYDINNAADFVSAFHQRYDNSIPREDRWKTFANAGFLPNDNTAPFPPANVHSTDHTAGVSSPDATISFAWNPAVELVSYVVDYNIWLRSSPSGAIVTTGPTGLHPETHWTTPTLPPGSYYLEVTAWDANGNIDNNLKGTSPVYVVRDPYPSDLNEWARTGWDDTVVPRSIAGATSGSVPLTPFLAGNVDSTWFNWAVENTGEVDITTSWRSRLVVDGAVIDSVSRIIIPPATTANTQTVLNDGPHNIRGGRHTVEVWAEAGEVVAESNENNNRFGAQFVWKPLTVSRNSNVTRPAPPDEDGGHEVLPTIIGMQKFRNCDGLRYSHTLLFPFTTTRWMAVESYAIKTAQQRLHPNNDLMLHLPSDGAEYGFTDGLVTSSRGGGFTDAIITNSVNAGETSWDVGVVNKSENTSDYHVRVNSAGTSAVGDSVTFNVVAEQMLVIRSLDVTAADAGAITAELRVLSGGPNWNISWYTSTATFRSLANANGLALANSEGFAQLSRTLATGFHGFVLWRDPVDGTGAATIQFKTYKKKADLVVNTPTGWMGPVVPRPTNDATTALAPTPAILYGDDRVTWLSQSLRNTSDVATPGFVFTRMLLDDDTAHNGTFTPFNALSTGVYPNITATTIPGGRHVLSFVVDPAGVTPELSELNNISAKQWVWMPDTLTAGVQKWRKGQIGGPTAGWEYTPPGEFNYFDCDGVRVPVPSAGVDFIAAAVTPRDSADVDLFAYLPTFGASAGFEVQLEESNWSGGETDLMLFNYQVAARTVYDLGITRVTEDTTSYVVEVAEGVVRNPAQAVHGPFTLGPHHLVQVHQFSLGFGRHVFRLRNLSGNVDWAMAAYNTSRPFQDRSSGEEVGWSYLAPGGADEELTLTLTSSATFAIVVYKTGSSETTKSGSYQLELGSNPLDAGPGDAVAVTRLAGAFPNPFRGASSVHFDLAREGEVTLEVFDVRGARVRTLARETRAAGRYQLAWDGRDDQGRATPAGMYVVRFAAAGHAATAKVVRLE